MKTLFECIQESMINERLMDGYFTLFEYRTAEKFNAKEWNEFFEKVSEDHNKELDVCGVHYTDIYVNGRTGTVKGKTTEQYYMDREINHYDIILLAMGKDGKAYCNDPEFLESIGLTPKKNSKFDQKNWEDENWDVNLQGPNGVMGQEIAHTV